MSANQVYSVGTSQVTVGRYTYGIEQVRILEWGEGAALSIGSFCSLASGITILLGGNHRTDWVTTYPFGHIFQDELGEHEVVGHPATKGDVVVGNDVWIGSNVTIMSGVRIGDGAVLAANACVSKDVASYQIVGGNPAVCIRQRFDDETIALLLKLRWWDFPVPKIKEMVQVLCDRPNKERLTALSNQRA